MNLYRMYLCNNKLLIQLPDFSPMLTGRVRRMLHTANAFDVSLRTTFVNHHETILSLSGAGLQLREFETDGHRINQHKPGRQGR